MSSWAIMVDAGHADDSCLVEIPYSSEFKRVSEAIQTAVTGISADAHVPLRFTRDGADGDWQTAGNYVRNLYENIFAAVCEGRSGAGFAVSEQLDTYFLGFAELRSAAPR